MKAYEVTKSERPYQRANAVGILGAEAWMREQPLDARKRIGTQAPRLQREPFVEHQGLIAPFLFEPLE